MKLFIDHLVPKLVFWLQLQNFCPIFNVVT